ncbi:hypothetical protein [Yoonia sp. 2307UL14-13]|uniref:hypothetical protein n=1 Tax=Yoonia sp. 2307UL14-13 TaxID=3126506 RepID=UPI0030A9E831
MRPALILLPLAALAACATPREQCINNALRETRIVDALVNETRANIARGYAIEEDQEVRTVPRRCTGERSDGTEFRYWCNDVQTIETSRPVAIDLNAEQAKLESLLERQAQNRAASDQRITQCIAAHPE